MANIEKSKQPRTILPIRDVNNTATTNIDKTKTFTNGLE